MAQVKFAYGTAAGYNNLQNKDANTVYFTTDEPAIYLGGHKFTRVQEFDAYIAATGDGGKLKTFVGDYLGGEKTLAQVLEDLKNAIDVAVSVTAVEDGSGDVNVLTGFEIEDGALKTGSVTEQKLKKVAVTGKAEDVAVIDTAGNYDATNVEGVLAEIATKIGSGVDSATVYMKDASEGQSDYAKVYEFYQGSDNTDMTKNTKIGTINIPLDKVVKDAKLVTEDAEGNKGNFLKIEFQNVEDPIYADLGKLADIYKGAENAEEVQITISDYTVSAAIVKVDGKKVIYQAAVPESSEGAGDGKAEVTVTAALNDLYFKIANAHQIISDIDAELIDIHADIQNTNKAIIDAIETLDADVDAETDSTITDTEKVAVVTGITEVDGKITAVDSIDVDKAGAATRAKNAVMGDATTDTVASKTIEGLVKKTDATNEYIGTIPSEAEATDIVGYIDEKTGDGVSALNSELEATVSDAKIEVFTKIVETEGKLNATKSTKAELAKVAKTGKAEDVDYDGTDNVKDALDTINGDNTTAGSIAKAQKDAIDTVVGTTTDAKTANTVNGAKAYAKDAVETALEWGTF